MAYGIHAPVDPVQPAGANPPCNRAFTQSERQELSTGDRPMLALGELGNQVIGRGCGEFSMYANGKSPDPRPAPR